MLVLINPANFKDGKCNYPWPCHGIVCADWCKID